MNLSEAEAIQRYKNLMRKADERTDTSDIREKMSKEKEKMTRESIMQKLFLCNGRFCEDPQCIFILSALPLTTGNSDTILIPLISKYSENIFEQGRFKWFRFSSLERAS